MPKGKKEAKKAPKTKKDKNAPKRAISAFFFYNQERRESLKQEQPNLSNKEIISTMSKEWNDLSEEKRKPYITKAENDKKRYLKENPKNVNSVKEKEEYEKKKKAEKPAKKTAKKEKKDDEDEKEE